MIVATIPNDNTQAVARDHSVMAIGRGMGRERAGSFGGSYRVSMARSTSSASRFNRSN